MAALRVNEPECGVGRGRALPRLYGFPDHAVNQSSDSFRGARMFDETLYPLAPDLWRAASEPKPT
jgi:hypothetical protein